MGRLPLVYYWAYLSRAQPRINVYRGWLNFFASRSVKRVSAVGAGAHMASADRRAYGDNSWDDKRLDHKRVAWPCCLGLLRLAVQFYGANLFAIQFDLDTGVGSRDCNCRLPQLFVVQPPVDEYQSGSSITMKPPSPPSPTLLHQIPARMPFLWHSFSSAPKIFTQILWWITQNPLWRIICAFDVPVIR